MHRKQPGFCNLILTRELFYTVRLSKFLQPHFLFDFVLIVFVAFVIAEMLTKAALCALPALVKERSVAFLRPSVSFGDLLAPSTATLLHFSILGI